MPSIRGHQTNAVLHSGSPARRWKTIAGRGLDVLRAGLSWVLTRPSWNGPSLALLVVSLGWLPQPAQAADTISFSERLTQSLDCDRECDPDFGCETFCEERTRISQSIRATLTLPALRHVDFADFVSFSLTIGNLSLYPDESSSATSNRIVFPSYRFDEFTEKRKKVGQIVFSKKGDVVTVTASYSAPESAIVADLFSDDAGVESGDENTGDVNFQMSIADVTIDKIVPFSARTTITYKTLKGDDEFSEEYALSSVQASGSASWGNPAVTIVHPIPAQRWSNEVFTISGTAVGTTDVAYVVVQPNRYADPIPVFPTNGLWELEASLVPGTNEVLAYCVDLTGTYSPGATVKFVYVRTSPLTVIIDPGPEGGTVIGANYQEPLEEGVSYTLTPIPATNYLFEKWIVQGGEVNGEFEQHESPHDQLSFTHEANLVITAVFVTNSFLPIAGSYAGLLGAWETRPEGVARLGTFTLKLTKTGQFTGKVLAGKYRHAFKGTADPRTGLAEFVFDEIDSSPIWMYLYFDFNGGSTLNGDISDGGSWGITMTGYRTAWPNEAASFVGKHTFLIPGAAAADAASQPAGDGAGRITIAASGMVTIVGTAGDGTPFTQSLPLCIDIAHAHGPSVLIPLFASAHKGQTLLSSFVEARSTDGAFGAPVFIWIKESDPSDRYYPDGFEYFNSPNQWKSLVAARYYPPGRNTNAVSWTEGTVLMDGGNLTATLSNRVTVALNKFTVVGENPNQLSLKLTPGTGLLSGTFLHPMTGRKVKFNGALLQLPSPEGPMGGGWFLGTSESGYLRLQPANAP